jgi:hypothetical protein
MSAASTARRLPLMLTNWRASPPVIAPDRSKRAAAARARNALNLNMIELVKPSLVCVFIVLCVAEVLRHAPKNTRPRRFAIAKQ